MKLPDRMSDLPLPRTRASHKPTTGERALSAALIIGGMFGTYLAVRVGNENFKKNETRKAAALERVLETCPASDIPVIVMHEQYGQNPAAATVCGNGTKQTFYLQTTPEGVTTYVLK